MHEDSLGCSSFADTFRGVMCSAGRKAEIVLSYLSHKKLPGIDSLVKTWLEVAPFTLSVDKQLRGFPLRFILIIACHRVSYWYCVSELVHAPLWGLHVPILILAPSSETGHV